MAGEDLAVVAKAGLSRAVHEVLVGAKLAEVGFDFSGGIVSGENSGLALEGEALGLEQAFGSREEVVGEAIEGLAMLAQTAGWLEEQRGSLKGKSRRAWTWRRRRAARWASCSKSSAESEERISAAALGVGARKSAAKSEMVKSIS